MRKYALAGILILVSCCGCSTLNQTSCMIKKNIWAIDSHTQSINENTKAIESANSAIEENIKQLDAINNALKKASES